MYTALMPAPSANRLVATSPAQAAEGKKPTLWDRFMAAASRSFELMAESKTRYPLD
jgi:hypothetical protein